MSKRNRSRNYRTSSSSYSSHSHGGGSYNFAPRSPHVPLIWQHFDRAALKRICEMRETTFATAFDMEVTKVNRPAPENFFAFKDNGSNILAVAHLDTVSSANQRTCNFIDTASGPVVYSRALDDRLGAYIILDLLPKLGINVDVLLTVGEESGRSTASFFNTPEGKEYNWVIEFDRGGCDVVMYQFHDHETAELVEESGARVGHGTFSDIAYLEQLGVKAFNWGVGYEDYHSARSHAYLDDTVKMVAYFIDFHAVNATTRLVHEESCYGSFGDDDDTVGYGYSYGGGWRSTYKADVARIIGGGTKYGDDDDIPLDGAEDNRLTPTFKDALLTDWSPVLKDEDEALGENESLVDYLKRVTASNLQIEA